MSILNSTKSGRTVVPITIKYLTDRHWRFKAHSKFSPVDYDIIWKNSSHCLRIKRDNFREVQYLFLEFETTPYTYRFTVKTVGDLDLVEEFWKKTQTGIHEDAIDVLRRNPENLTVEDNGFWEFSTASLEFGKYAYSEYDNKDFTDQPWKTKNKKNYFASYFK